MSVRSRKPKLNPNQLRLIRRYLIWCYKTTKEDLDRIDRYFTQEYVDQFLLDHLQGAKDQSADYSHLVEEFKAYMQKKQDNALKQKYSDHSKSRIQPQYNYLKNRLCAIEAAIIYFLGKKQLDKIIDLYEEEMTERILTAREHS